MRWTSLFFALPLVACTGGGDASSSPEAALGVGAPADSANTGGDLPLAAPLAEPAAVRPVTLTIPSLPAKPTSPIVFIGFEPEAVTGNWAQEGVSPNHHTVTAPVELAGTVEIDVPLLGELTYFALLDLDGDGVPSDGEGVSGPVLVGKDTSAAPGPFVIELTWGAPGSGLGVPPGDAEVAPEGAPVADPTPERVTGDPVKRRLRLDTEQERPVLDAARVLVVGMPASDGDAYVGPLIRDASFVWASDSLKPTWPLELDVQVPPGGDVQILLDIDGDLLPSVGDLASSPLVNFEPVPEGSDMDVTLVGTLGRESKGDEGKAEEPGEVPGESEQLGEPLPDPG